MYPVTTTRWRSFDRDEYVRKTANSLTGPTEAEVISHRSHQFTQSQGNPYQKLGRESLIDVGGPFLTVKTEVEYDTQVWPIETRYISSGAVREGWYSRLVPSLEVSNQLKEDFNDEQHPSLVPYNTLVAGHPGLLQISDLDELGATAVSRVAPTNPLVDGSVAIAELIREGLPSMVGKSGNVGSEYLNINFGILPLYSDYKSFREALSKADAHLQQLERDSGRIVRRGYQFPEEVTTSKVIQSGVFCVTSNGLAPATASGIQTGTLVKVSRQKTKSWFSGAFTFYLPPQGWRRRLWELDRLYGITPGVDTAWNLMPWSWLVDYFSNAGDVLSNINSFSADGLIMPYGYVMSTSEIEDEYTWTGMLKIQTIWTLCTVKARVKRTLKQRQPANPFGFGFGGDLSVRQGLILAALGISRA